MSIIKTQLKYAEVTDTNKVLANKTVEIQGANLLLRTDKDGYPVGENVVESQVVDNQPFKVVVFQNEKFKVIDGDLVGNRGAKGPQGLDGSKGPQGDVGPQGLSGKDGLDGKNGLDGSKGPTGDKGQQGDKGVSGDKGIDGDKGPQGERGPQGLPGGAQGAQGPQGLPGTPKIVYKLSSTTTTIRNLTFNSKVFFQNAIIGEGEHGSISIDLTKKICFADCIFNFDDVLIDIQNDIVPDMVNEISFERCQFNGLKANGSIIKFSNNSELKVLSFTNNTFETNIQDDLPRFIVSGLGRGAYIGRLIFNDNDLSDFGTGQKFEVPQLFHPSVESYIIRNNRGFATKITKKVVINTGSTNSGFIMLPLNEFPFGFADDSDQSLSSLKVIPVSHPGNSTTGNGWYISKHTNWPTETTPAKFMLNSIMSPLSTWSFVIEVNCETKN